MFRDVFAVLIQDSSCYTLNSIDKNIWKASQICNFIDYCQDHEEYAPYIPYNTTHTIKFMQKVLWQCMVYFHEIAKFITQYSTQARCSMASRILQHIFVKPGLALIFKGGYDACTWSYKVDPTQVLPLTKKMP